MSSTNAQEPAWVIVSERGQLRLLHELLEVPMTRKQEQLGRALAKALRAIEFTTQLTDRWPLVVAEMESGAEVGLGGPRVEVRHPTADAAGCRWLVAVVSLEPEARVSYAARPYRAAIERAVARVMASRGSGRIR